MPGMQAFEPTAEFAANKAAAAGGRSSLQVACSLAELRAACEAARCRTGPLGLVPTMGALHAGHLALVAAAQAQCGAVAASIYVNPTQFAASEDLGRYPRPLAQDLALLQASGCSIVWLPDNATMYPPDDVTVVELGGPARRWEGVQRPGHFRGVATVVAKLLGQVRPDRAHFGEKDWQQLQVIRRMAEDLHLATRIIGVPTIRDDDGLALSSRNRFLSQEQRALAPMLYAVLCRIAAAGRHTSLPARLAAGRAELAAAGFVIDYLEAVDARSLEPIAAWRGDARLLAAARLGAVRLLDNVALD